MIPITNITNFFQTIESPIPLGEILELLKFSRQHCVFIKDEAFSYCYANDNYVRLMGLKKWDQLLDLDDYDLSKKKEDAQKYRELDCYALELGKSLKVCETISPSHNQHLAKTMNGTLYPLFGSGGKANYVLGLVTPACNILKLDFDAIFNLTQKEIAELLVKRSYSVQGHHNSITLSRMEIRTLIQLFKGQHAGEVAQSLEIKQTTVESYIDNIKNKLGVFTKSELMQVLIHEKILEQIIL